jgi:signal transduction histidine kinase
MKRLIQDLLDVTRVEAGQLALERAALPTRDVVAEAVEAHRALAAAGAVDLRLAVAEPLPRIFADRHRVLQVFENLVGNALKFTPAGARITVGALAQAGSVLCYVRDTGPGIPVEAHAHLFDRYWQAGRSQGEKHSGAGLGLAIVKGIVEAHGGRVWLESAPGEGSTFYFTFPTTTDAEVGVPTAVP